MTQFSIASLKTVWGKQTSIERDKQQQTRIAYRIHNISESHRTEMCKDSSNSSTTIPKMRPKLPNKREIALRRLAALQRSLKQNQKKKGHYFKFMQDIFVKRHAKTAPALNGEECWYLSHFGVYHLHKLDKIRVVFDPSCQFKDMSLTNVLLNVLDLMNSLFGVLMRFCHEPVAFIADIQQMFHSIFVKPDHRNFLRFLWHMDKNPDSDIVEDRMKIHLFGNSPLQAVTT